MLQLRQNTDSLLEKNGLSNVHLESKNNILLLAGKCGQSIVTIHGVIVPSKINSIEREYLLGLIENFINENVKNIIKIMKFKFDNVLPGDFCKDYKLKVNSGYGHNDANDYVLVFNNKIEMELSHTGAVTVSADECSLSEMKDFLQKEKELVKILKKYQKEMLQHNKLIKLVGELSVCTI